MSSAPACENMTSTVVTPSRAAPVLPPEPDLFATPPNSPRSPGVGVRLDTEYEYEPGTVVLNVYDATQMRIVGAFNGVSFWLGAGAFHVGVEVQRQEWSFGRSSGGSGVSYVRPKKHPLHRFRKAVSLGATRMSRVQVANLLLDLSGSWLGADYDILNKNCVHFAQAFCVLLGAEAVPLWVDRLARGAESLSVPLGHVRHSLKSLHADCRPPGPWNCGHRPDSGDSSGREAWRPATASKADVGVAPRQDALRVVTLQEPTASVTSATEDGSGPRPRGVRCDPCHCFLLGCGPSLSSSFVQKISRAGAGAEGGESVARAPVKCVKPFASVAPSLRCPSSDFVSKLPKQRPKPSTHSPKPRRSRAQVPSHCGDGATDDVSEVEHSAPLARAQSQGSHKCSL